MAKINLNKFSQKGYEMYSFFCNPNLVYNKSNFKSIVDDESFAQRPYNPSRVKGVIKYVLGEDTISKKTKLTHKAKGLIPNSIILNIPKKYISGNILDLNGDEKDIEVLDGQHRLLAFNDDTIKKLEDKEYLVNFIAFIDLDEELKKEIFMVLNERQTNVDKNILLSHKKWLNILPEEDEVISNLIYSLADDKKSPFKGRIIKSGEKIKYGIKVLQLSEVIKKYGILNNTGILGKDGSISNKGYEVIINFLISWEETFESAWFENNNTLTKIAGIRMIFNLFQSYLEIIKSHFNGEIKLENFKKITGYISEEYFNSEFDVSKFEINIANAFRERSTTEFLASKIGADIVEHFAVEGNSIFK